MRLGAFVFDYRGYRSRVQIFNRREAELSRFMVDRLPEDVSKLVLCPMPGLLVDLRVIIGEKVLAGQTLCIIEAMKLFNEIESEISGTIVKILVDDASPVEFDQPLFIINPS